MLFDDKEFDRSLNRMQKIALLWMCFYAILSLSVLFGIGWVVYKVLTHYGIV